jgi:hypothetical protein
MKAKHMFREGWIMLLRPFQFGELSKPLQKLTVLYAYSEQPIIKMELTQKGVDEMDLVWEYYGKNGSLGHHHNVYSKRTFETDELYELRMEKVINKIWRDHATQENYEGQIVQCYVEGELCRFYPDEYKIISSEFLDYLLTCDEHEYQLEIEDGTIFTTQDMKNKVFYTRSRGIPKTKALKMNSREAKDCVIFRPQQAILDMFCRENEIF